VNTAEAGAAGPERRFGAPASCRALLPAASPRGVGTTERVDEVARWSFEGRRAVASLFRALGEPGRLSLVGFIAEAERCGTECRGHLGLSQGRVSAHLARLVACGIVSQRRAGRRVLYRVADRRALELLALGWAIAAPTGRRESRGAGTS
jgi:DNA-binding transcriptional ArsR family regulator